MSVAKKEFGSEEGDGLFQVPTNPHDSLLVVKVVY